MEKSVIADYGVIDINKPVAIPVMYDTNKKTLRGRGGGQLIEPANYFNQNQSSKIPEFNLKLAFDDLRIRQDLAAITDQSGERRFPRSTVVISKPRVIIDGKTFKQGEELLVSNSSNEPFLAKMEYVNERMITFKAAKVRCDGGILGNNILPVLFRFFKSIFPELGHSSNNSHSGRSRRRSCHRCQKIERIEYSGSLMKHRHPDFMFFRPNSCKIDISYI